MSYLKRLAISLLAAMIAGITLQRIIYRIFWEFNDKHYPPPEFAIIAVIVLVLVAIVSSRRGRPTPAVWQDILAGFTALDMAMFGWQKLFHLQGFIPLARLDEPLRSFSGESLTWAFFYHSYAFFDLVALLQITGALLLTIRRTRLFGAVVLFPVMLNIVLINSFYGFETGDTVHALILLIGLAYLILQHYPRLVAVFFAQEGTAPRYRFLAPVVIVLPLLLVLSFGSPDHHPRLTGKYRVEDLSVNGIPSSAVSCGDSVLTAVYWDQEDQVVLEFNGIRRRWIGSYRLNPSTNTMQATWHFPAQARDTLYWRLESPRPGEWRIRGTIGKDSLSARLVKE